MKDELQSTRDANAIFRIALAFLALAVILFLSTATAPLDSDLTIALATGCITVFVAGVILAFWSAIKARSDQVIISFIHHQLAKFGFYFVFTLRRALLHLALSALLAAATHFYFMEVVYREAGKRAESYATALQFRASMPDSLNADIVELASTQPDGKLIQLSFDKRPASISSKYYRQIRQKHFRHLLEVHTHKANLVNKDAMQKIENAFRNDIQWISLTPGTLAQFEAALAKQPLVIVNEKIPATQFAPQFLNGDRVHSHGAFGFDRFCLNTPSYSFAQDGDKLFVRNILTGDNRWVITPSYVVTTIRYTAPQFYLPRSPNRFSQTLPGRLLTFAASAFALSLPFFYLRRKTAPRREHPAL